MAIRVLMADDHGVVRDAMRSTVGTRDGIEFVGEAGDGCEAVRLTQELCPDVVIMDIAMPGMNGIEATREICATCPSTAVLALTMHAGHQFVLEMLQAGARGYIVKTSPLDELERAIRAVAEGHVYLSGDTADFVLEDYLSHLDGSRASATNGGKRPLTPRERECLKLMAEGHSTKEIAAILGLSPKTVETHRRQMMDKTGIFSLAGLIKLAIREGLATVEC